MPAMVETDPVSSCFLGARTGQYLLPIPASNLSIWGATAWLMPTRRRSFPIPSRRGFRGGHRLPPATNESGSFGEFFEYDIVVHSPPFFQIPIQPRLYLLADIDLVHHLVPCALVGKLSGDFQQRLFDGGSSFLLFVYTEIESSVKLRRLKPELQLSGQVGNLPHARVQYARRLPGGGDLERTCGTW